jgi:hypothetical protein
LLADEDVPRQSPTLGESDEHLLQQLGRADDVGRGALEQVEELAIAGAEQAAQGCQQPARPGVLAAHRRRSSSARGQRPATGLVNEM